MKTSSLAAMLLLPMAVLAQTAPLLDITDPERDDVGDGSLVYPRDSAYQPGDLDLRSLRVFAEGKDLRFEATFRNPIRHPSTVMSPGMGAESLSYFARNGFFAFNVDIYLDTDRVAGSGNTVTLPGRRALLDPAHAWEKAVVLTPRPEVIRRQFGDALRQTSSASEADVKATVDRSVFFPTQVRVQGRTVSFTVPGSFVDAATMQGASMTALVTAAPLTIDSGFNLTIGDMGSPRERFPLGVAQPEVGEPELTMGFRSAPVPATSVVDLLSPDPRQQAAQLAPGARLTGLNRENNLGKVPLATTVTAAAPATVAPAPTASGGSWFSSALASVSGFFGSSAPAPAAAATAAPAAPQSVQSLMAPQSAPVVAPPAAGPAAAVGAPAATAVAVTAAPPPAVAAPSPSRAVVPPAPAAATAAVVAPAAAAATAAPAKARDASFYEEQEYRLRTLKRLRDSGLISEDEYQQKRRAILDLL